MCFGGKESKVEAPPPPAETLEQVAPEKKTAAKINNSLSIGTKKYRNESGLGTSGMISGSPSGLSLSK